MTRSAKEHSINMGYNTPDAVKRQLNFEIKTKYARSVKTPHGFLHW
jgi:hypothetical protein